VEFAAPTLVAQRLTIADYRNKTYFRGSKMLRKLEPAVLNRGIKERNYDGKVANGHSMQENEDQYAFMIPSS
jgi:hypothetical protein